MMRFEYKDFLIYSGMDDDDPRAIPEFEIMSRISRLLPETTSATSLIRFWRRAFRDQPDMVRRGVYRVQKGCEVTDKPGDTLNFTPFDFIAFSQMERTDEGWYTEFTIMRRIAEMVPASTPTSAVRRLWRDSFQRAPLSQRRGVSIKKPVPDIYGSCIHPVTSVL